MDEKANKKKKFEKPREKKLSLNGKYLFEQLKNVYVCTWNINTIMSDIILFTTVDMRDNKIYLFFF